MAYFGDHFWSDVYAATLCKPPGEPQWQSIGVVEDLWFFDNAVSGGKDPKLAQVGAFWGLNYFSDTVDGRQVKHLFARDMERAARYAVPLLRNINMLMR